MTREENEQRLEHCRNKVLAMPEMPGCYKFHDKEGKIIYVGKAKNLKRRVSSYFHKEVDRYKTKVLVSKTWDITYSYANTEEDALLMENSMIKQYNPRYNVLLKDGKTYPSICITKEPYPRIFNTRTINKKYGIFYGPYSKISGMYNILEIIKRAFKPRSCRLPLTPESIKEGKFKPCLEYHIGNCLGPCIGRQSYEDYQENILQAREVLKGNTRDMLKHLAEKMMKKAEELKFEEAEILKQRHIMLENFVAKSEVVSYTIKDVDVFTIEDDDLEKNAFINYMHVRNGSINQSFTYEYKRKLKESDEELLMLAIPEIRSRFESSCKEVIVPFEMNWKLKDAEFFVPERGDKRHLLELSQMNAKQYKFDRLKQAEKLNPEQKQTRLMKKLQERLKLPKLPYHIECFDNSNISGTDAVAGCVVYKGMKPSRRDYRRYIIKTVKGPDDYASMQEVVRRRYSRMIEEGESLPDLIITDGGKGQMEVVKKVVERELQLEIAIAGLAKDGHHRTNELLYGSPPQVIGLKTNSELFHALTRIQDDVHNYAIAYHRNKRSKHALHSELDDIKGIGSKTQALLLKSLKSVKQIKQSDYQSLVNLIGASKGKIVYEHFHPTKQPTEES